MLVDRFPVTLRRLALLAGCVVVGSLVGFVGLRWSGGAIWFLAVPVLIGVAWLVVADPGTCSPTKERPTHDS